ncbi:LOW QUALITY PROTEIN: hypothetical protein Bca4012_072948 [Brassica carinata]
MSQSQLLGKSGDLKNAEGTRKRLKISVPHFDNTELIKQYDKTIIGRCMNPEAQDVKALIVMLPKIWKVEDRVAGTDLGLGKFQFDFVEEEDIETVLKSQPFHFDYWMVALARWQPKMPRDFPAAIPFWIKILGVPLEFWDAPTFQSIGDALGETVEVDLDYGRIKVIIDTRKELSFDTTVDFIGGEFHEGDEAFISLNYEKLFGFCETCLSLSHSVDYCPLTVKSPQKKKEVRELPISRQEDRARSYKGVVINGDGGQHGKGREYREYLGKGKGKMYEEHETKWVGFQRKEVLGIAQTVQATEETRMVHVSGALVAIDHEVTLQRNVQGRIRGAQRGSSPRAGVGEEAREEGEIPQKGQGSASRTVLETSLPLPQQDSSAIILAEVNKVPLIPESEENGLDVVNDLLGEDIVDGEDDGMELDEESVNVVGNEEDSDDGFNNLTDGDVAVEGNNDKIPEESHELDEEAIQPEVAEGKEQIPGEADKKKVVRKSLFKSSAIAGGSTKARMVQALVATRKRTVSKTAPRHGEGAKQQEEKGPSNPKPNVTKV